MKKILITGGNGFIARNIKPLFEANGYIVLAPSKEELNVLDSGMLTSYLVKESPNIIIHAATKGGRRTKVDTFDDVYLPNIKMFENLYDSNLNDLNIEKIIFIGSGAEFDRRFTIWKAKEMDVNKSWPVDPYGLSKNIITKRILSSPSYAKNLYVVRLFGCFNWDEDETRFIKNSIIRLKKGLPIEIHENRQMSYFYMDDVYSIINYIIHEINPPQNLNLVYEELPSLLDIAKMIHKHANIYPYRIKMLCGGCLGMPYVGDSGLISQLPLYKSLVGLDEGIRRTVCKLM